jgi:hypothetical protein
VDKLALRQVFLQVIWFFPLVFIPLMIPTHSVIYHDCS